MCIRDRAYPEPVQARRLTPFVVVCWRTQESVSYTHLDVYKRQGRIKDIEAKLSNAQVIDITKMPNNGRVIFGSTVSVLNLDTDEEQTYRIVGDDEADFKQNLISVNSPIARGLIGKEQDDVVTIRTPGGEVEYEITKVEYL